MNAKAAPAASPAPPGLAALRDREYRLVADYDEAAKRGRMTGWPHPLADCECAWCRWMREAADALAASYAVLADLAGAP